MLKNGAFQRTVSTATHNLRIFALAFVDSIILKIANKILICIALALGIPGCSVFDQYFASAPVAEPEVAVIPLAERPRLPPISRNYFLIEDENQSIIGEPQVVFARGENSFSDFAREYGLGYDELVEANPGIDPWLPGEGTPILLPTQYILPDVPRRGLVLNIAMKRLFYFPPVGEGAKAVVMTFPIGIGRVGWETPIGETEVVSKARDPHWYVPASVRKEHAEKGDPLPAVVGPGPDNPLGRHVLKLGLPGYLIHGTNKPVGVGMRVSHGCVRLYPENIELLYSLVDPGEPVRIINEPYLLAHVGDDLYLESHTPLEDDEVESSHRLQRLLDSDEAFSSEGLTNIAKSVASASSGSPTRLQANDSMEVFARARIVTNTVQADPDAPTLAEVRALLDAEVDSDGDDDVAPAKPAALHE